MNISGALQAGCFFAGCLGIAKRIGPPIMHLTPSIVSKATNLVKGALETMVPVVASGITSAPAATAAEALCSLYAARTAYHYLSSDRTPTQKPKTHLVVPLSHSLPNNKTSLLEITRQTPLLFDRVNRDRTLPTVLKGTLAMSVISGYVVAIGFSIAGLIGIGILSACPPLMLCAILIAAVACLASSINATLEQHMFEDTYHNAKEIKKFILSSSPLGALFYGLSIFHSLFTKLLDD